MTLIVDSDTFISLADAKTYATAHKISTDTILIAWNALADTDKEILLRKATQIIDRQPLAGIRAIWNQTLEFPRVTYSDYQSDIWHSPDWWYPLALTLTVPDAVKHAQCEIALSLVAGTSARVQMQREGVRSFNLGGLSESYVGTQTRLCFEAMELLAPYLARSVQIC